MPSDHRRGASRRGAVRAAALAGLAALVVGLFAAALYERVSEERDRSRLEVTVGLVTLALEEGLTDTERRLSAVAGLWAASDEVSNEEFRLFAERAKLAGGAAGWAVVEIVDKDHVTGVIEPDPSNPWVGPEPGHAGPHYLIRQSVSSRPGVDPRGVDLGAFPAPRLAISYAVASKGVRTSPLFEFPFLNGPGFVMAQPVVEPDGSIARVVVTAVEVAEFLETHVPDSVAAEVDLRMMRLEGLATEDGTPSIVRNVQVAGRDWTIGVAPLPSSPLLAPSVDPLLALTVSALVGLLAGLATFLFVRRRHAQRALESNIRLNEARDEFLGVISHEIRTPLTAVVGFASELRSSWEYLDNDERLDLLRTVDEQAREVSAIVADLLVIGRADIDSLHLSCRPTALGDAVGPALESIPEEDRRRIGADVDGHRVIADRNRLSQVLRNLVSNACAYGGEHVWVRAEESGSMIHLLVEDDGGGIPEPFRESVFDAYVHLPRDERPLPSVGLGLYVARRLAEAMGGSLEYRREGGLTVFDLALPKAETVEQAAQPAASQVS